MTPRAAGALVLVLLALAATAQAATLRLYCTAPSESNDGTCAEPVLLVRDPAPLWVHFEWSGPAAGEDSISVSPGADVEFARQVPAGFYQVRAWASDEGGQGCDTTIRVVVKGPPATVKFR